MVICTQQSHFQFQRKFYDQINGVAMSSPLGPLFANAFMSSFETKHINQLNTLGVKRWLRYVDDVFATIESREKAATILEFLNKQHPSLKFTIEHEDRDRLDVTVVRNVGKYTTTIYRKPTFTGVYINWTSLTASINKLGPIRCLAERIWRICSEPDERHREIEKLKQNLYRNDYPVDVVELTINKFLEKKAKQPSEPPSDIRHKKFLKLPYVSNKC